MGLFHEELTVKTLFTNNVFSLQNEQHIQQKYPPHSKMLKITPQILGTLKSSSLQIKMLAIGMQLSTRSLPLWSNSGN